MTWLAHGPHGPDICVTLLITFVGHAPHMYMSHVARAMRRCWKDLFIRIICRAWFIHVTHMNESWHKWMRHVTQMKEAWVDSRRHLLNTSCWAISCALTLIKRTPPSRGGFLFTMFPHQEPCVRGPPSKDLYQVLRGGSSYTRFLMREHSR